MVAVDTDVLRIIMSTADELSGGTNPKKMGLSDVLLL